MSTTPTQTAAQPPTVPDATVCDWATTQTAQPRKPVTPGDIERVKAASDWMRAIGLPTAFGIK